MKRILKYCRGNRGVATILIAGVMVVFLLGFLIVGMDFSYMYYVRGEVQNAADAAALAGAAKISNPNDLSQTDARAEAVSYALKNKAAGSFVQISDGGVNAFSDTNDITVGHWDGSTYTAGTTPVNAVQVRGRRTSASLGGPVGLLFGKIAGWSNMGVGRTAIAARIAKVNSYFMLQENTCLPYMYPTISSPVTLDPPIILQSGTESSVSPNKPFAWSSLLTNTTGPGITLNELICQNSANAVVCGQSIYATMGGPATTLRDLKAIYNASKDADGGWWLIVPYSLLWPGAEGSSSDPKPVVGYAKIRVSAVCSSGVGSPCGGTLPSVPNSSACAGAGSAIIIDRIQCASCADFDEISGAKAYLVK